MRADWTSPDGMFGGGLGNRFYSLYIDEYPDANGNLRTVGSYSLWDGSGVYKPTPILAVVFGIRNLFDTSPPFTTATAAGMIPVVARAPKLLPRQSTTQSDGVVLRVRKHQAAYSVSLARTAAALHPTRFEPNPRRTRRYQLEN